MKFSTMTDAENLEIGIRLLLANYAEFDLTLTQTKQVLYLFGFNDEQIQATLNDINVAV